nr:hypothetical protein CoNPh37_CDS0115 [Staphylococcus phage S-CoN_Ph37]
MSPKIFFIQYFFLFIFNFSYRHIETFLTTPFLYIVET